jgi:DNA-binding FadR family transcriptional regulator
VPTADGAAFRGVLDDLGRAIVEGRMAAGDTDTVDAVVARSGASRPVVREATRVLVSLGMLSAGRRVGLRVRPSDEWDLLDPQLIRWRLESSGRAEQLRELRGLRLVVEPEAARLTAIRGTDADALGRIADELQRATTERDGPAFLDADRRFHALLLAGAGNRMLVRLRDVVDEALRERTPGDSHRWQEAPDDVALHREVADAVAAQDAERAAATMRRILGSF